MAQGLFSGPSSQNSSSIQLNPHILGGVMTGSGGNFFSLAISGTTKAGGGPSDAFLGQGYRADTADLANGSPSAFTGSATAIFLSSSFAGFSSSIVQAINYVKHVADQGSGDISGPGSSVTDNAIVRWDTSAGTDTLIQNSTLILADGASPTLGVAADTDLLSFADSKVVLSGAIGIQGETHIKVGETIGCDDDPDQLTFTDGKIDVSGVLAVDGGAISGTSFFTFGGHLSGTGGISGSQLVISRGKTIGPDNDTDLITLHDGAIELKGHLSGTGGLSGSGLVISRGKSIGPDNDTDLITLTDGVMTVAGNVVATNITGTTNVHAEVLAVSTVSSFDGNITIGANGATTTILPAHANAIVQLGSAALPIPQGTFNLLNTTAPSVGAAAITLGGAIGGVDGSATKLSCGGDLVISSSLNASQFSVSLSTSSFGGIVFPGTDVDGKVRSFKLIIRGGMLQATPVANEFEPGV